MVLSLLKNGAPNGKFSFETHQKSIELSNRLFCFLQFFSGLLQVMFCCSQGCAAGCVAPSGRRIIVSYHTIQHGRGFVYTSHSSLSIKSPKAPCPQILRQHLAAVSHTSVSRRPALKLTKKPLFPAFPAAGTSFCAQTVVQWRRKGGGIPFDDYKKEARRPVC